MKTCASLKPHMTGIKMINENKKPSHIKLLLTALHSQGSPSLKVQLLTFLGTLHLSTRQRQKRRNVTWSTEFLQDTGSYLDLPLLHSVKSLFCFLLKKLIYHCNANWICESTNKSGFYSCWRIKISAFIPTGSIKRLALQCKYALSTSRENRLSNTCVWPVLSAPDLSLVPKVKKQS